jgi:hypothetical protein
VLIWHSVCDDDATYAEVTQVTAERVASRPGWAYALVPVYLTVGYGTLLLFRRSSQVIYAFAFYLLPVVVATGLAAAVLLVLTRHSPWLSPALDALLAVVLALPFASILLCVSLIIFAG